MTSFVHIDYPTQHLGVARFGAVIETVGQFRKEFDGTKSLAAMLLAAMVAALVVAADQLVDTWADGHLLAAWVTLWVVAFSALALLAPATRQLVAGVVASLTAWSARAARARADERLWALAQTDSRVLADLQAAMTRSET